MKMAKMADLLTTDTPPCVVCDAAEKAKAEGRKGFSVSTSGKALCPDHYQLKIDEMMCRWKL
jgi:hypothetical protein